MFDILEIIVNKIRVVKCAIRYNNNNHAICFRFSPAAYLNDIKTICFASVFLFKAG